MKIDKKKILKHKNKKILALFKKSQETHGDCFEKGCKGKNKNIFFDYKGLDVKDNNYTFNITGCDLNSEHWNEELLNIIKLKKYIQTTIIAKEEYETLKLIKNYDVVHQNIIKDKIMTVNFIILKLAKLFNVDKTQFSNVEDKNESCKDIIWNRRDKKIIFEVVSTYEHSFFKTKAVQLYRQRIEEKIKKWKDNENKYQSKLNLIVFDTVPYFSNKILRNGIFSVLFSSTKKETVNEINNILKEFSNELNILLIYTNRFTKNFNDFSWLTKFKN